MEITIQSKGVQQGPFPVEQVKTLLQSGQVSSSDLGWSPGMAEWKPLATFPELQGPPPVPGAAVPPAVPTRTEPMAVWAIVLGIISFLGCSLGGFLAGIPAVICGHIGLARIKRNPALRGGGMALTGLITGYISIAVIPLALLMLAIAIPNMADVAQRAKTAMARSDAKILAAQAAAARAAGYTQAWESKEDAIRELTAGITVDGQTFKAKPSTPEASAAAAKFLELQDNQLLFNPGTPAP